MKAKTLGIAGVYLIEFPHYTDDRGSFGRLFDAQKMQDLPINTQVAQINLSRTTQAGTLRGMHVQLAPFLETKMVRCVQGVIFDVVLDLRLGSPTFLKHLTLEIQNPSQVLVIPEGCAHGFQSLTPQVEMIYTHSASYDPASERTFSAFDPHFAIKWPLPVTEISSKDQNARFMDDNFLGVACEL